MTDWKLPVLVINLLYVLVHLHSSVHLILLFTYMAVIITTNAMCLEKLGMCRVLYVVCY